MFHVEEKENALMKECISLKQEKRELYIYGCGIAGKMVFHILQGIGVRVDGFCVDQGYWKPGMDCCGKPVASIEDIERKDQNGEGLTVFMAFETEKPRHFNGSERLKVIDMDFSSFGISAPKMEESRIDRAYVDTHADAFAKLYDMLGDGKSRQCLTAYLNQRISGKLEYLACLHDGNQYYDKGLVHLEHVACMVDCGAYDGDSFRSFCENYRQDAGKGYSGMAFLLEPDRGNFKKLANAYLGQEKVIPVNMGAWDKKDTLCFEENNTASSISASGGVSIEVDSIDHIAFQARGGRLYQNGYRGQRAKSAGRC